MFKLKGSKAIDMTEGNVYNLLLKFALPMFFGSVFQVLYNTVDTWVIGNFSTTEAYSAVGGVGTIVVIFISFLYGFSTGVTVLVSQCFGAKLYDRLEKIVHTAVATSVIIWWVIAILGCTLTPFMLKVTNMPENVIPFARDYLIIYFAGSLGNVVYSICNGIMCSLGDSKTSLYLLIVSCFINLVLDLLFVIKFNMDAGGVALATVISQTVCAILAFTILCKRSDAAKVYIKKLKIDAKILILIVKVGIPRALQFSITSISNTIIHAYINAFGTVAMAGVTTYNKIETLILPASYAINGAISTFFGQNIGKGDIARAKEGIKKGFVLSLVIGTILIGTAYIFVPQLAAFFNDDALVVEAAVSFSRLIMPFLLFAIIKGVYSAALNSSGNTKTAMLAGLVGEVTVLQGYLLTTNLTMPDSVMAIIFSSPFGWMVSALLHYACYRRINFKKTVL